MIRTVRRSAAAVALAAALTPALALGAGRAEGTYSGAVHFTDHWNRRVTFDLHAKFQHGALVRLYGEGPDLPYNPHRSSGQYCGVGSVYDSADDNGHGLDRAAIHGGVHRDGSFDYKVVDQMETVYIGGRFDSSRSTSGTFRMTRRTVTGDCDSGYLPLRLRR